MLKVGLITAQVGFKGSVLGGVAGIGDNAITNSENADFFKHGPYISVNVNFFKWCMVDIYSGKSFEKGVRLRCGRPQHGVQRRMISVDNFFLIFEIIIFCFVVAICDLVHDVVTIFHLSYVLTAFGNIS